MINKIYELGVLPVIKIDDAADAPALAKALIDGDLPAAEVTFRTKAAKASIEAMAKHYPDMLLGAGTVLTTQQVDEAMSAGAKFIISPGLNPKVVDYCVNKKIPIFPGVTSPSDIEVALEFGLDVVKFFPAEASGGLNMLKAMSAPYGNVRFMPTGGIDLTNIEKYLAFDKIVACGGSWMVPPAAIANKEFDKITKLSYEAVMKVIGFKFQHLGVNNPSEAEGKAAADKLKIFNCQMVSEAPAAIYLEDIEVMKKKAMGDHGHIGFYVNNTKRALAYLKTKGILPIAGTEKLDEKGNIRLVYVNFDVSGFAVHITQK